MCVCVLLILAVLLHVLLHHYWQDENTRLIRELRAEISALKDNLTDEAGPGSGVPTATKEVSRLEAMIHDLQVAKQQTWEEKERLSEMYEEERRKNLASKVNRL